MTGGEGSPARAVGVGVIGLGFMGRTHVRAYRGAGAHLVAVSDSDPGRLGGRADAAGNLETGATADSLDLRGARATADLDEFFATAGLELVSVCTPTDTHRAVATAALRAGKHVVLEKPVALDVRSAEAVREEAERAGRLCMPAMCMRFWPAWAWVKRAVDDGRFGAVVTMRLERLGGPPAWSQDYYEDESRSGGALFDLHVHDTDFVVHCFGRPSEVVSVGGVRHLSTVYRFENGPGHVSAQGGWVCSPAWAFRMRFVIEFERAVADFDLAREPQLVVHDGDGQTHVPELEAINGWEGEIRAMLAAVARGDGEAPASMRQAGEVIGVLECERESLRSGRAVRVGG